MASIYDKIFQAPRSAFRHNAASWIDNHEARLELLESTENPGAAAFEIRRVQLGFSLLPGFSNLASPNQSWGPYSFEIETENFIYGMFMFELRCVVTGAQSANPIVANLNTSAATSGLYRMTAITSGTWYCGTTNNFGPSVLNNYQYQLIATPTQLSLSNQIYSRIEHTGWIIK